MKEHYCTSHIAVPLGCGLFAAVEVCDGLAKAEVIAGVRSAQKRVLLIGLALAVPSLLALLLWG